MEDAISRIISELGTHHETNFKNLNSQPLPSISKSALSDLQTLLKDDDIDTLFEEISTKNLCLSSLVSLISSAIDSSDAHFSLSASNVYLSLLLSPNVPVFTLFTPMAFLSLLQSIRRSFRALRSDPSSQTSINRQRKGKRALNKSSQIHRMEVDSDDVDERENDQFDIRALFSLLGKLESVLGLVHLNRFSDSLKSLIQTVASIPVLALEFGGNLGYYKNLTDSCSRILYQVLKPEHGDLVVTVAEVSKSLTPCIIMGKCQARTFGLGFVTNQMMGIASNSEEIKKAIVNLPRYLSHKAPEKSEPRALAVEAIMEVVRVMEFEDQIDFADYVVKMTQGVARHRLLAVDIIPMLIMSLRDPFGLDLEFGGSESWGLRCLNALIERCSDATVSIRSRALTCLAQLVGFLSVDERNRAVLRGAMRFGNEGCQEMNDLLRKRCMDEKAAIRKASLLLITKLMALLGGSIDVDLLKTIGMACSDPLVSIRKAAISALSEAFRTFSDENVTIEWLHSVPRLITDNETSIQEECENLFLELVLDRVSRAGRSGLSLNQDICHSRSRGLNFESEIESLFPGGVLNLLKEICDGEVLPWVKKICTNLGKKKCLKSAIAVALQNIITTSESLWMSHSKPIEKWTAPPGTWVLLSEVSVFLTRAIGWEFLHHHWQLLDKHNLGTEMGSPLLHVNVDQDIGSVQSISVAWAGDRVSLLQTISNVSVELPPEPAADLAHNLLKRVEEFNMHPTEVNAHVKALRTLCKRKASNSKEAEDLVMRWVQQLLSKASNILKAYVSDNSEKGKSSSFLTPPRSGGRKGKRELSEAVTAIYTIGSLITICPAADMNSIIPTLHAIITSGTSNLKRDKLPGPTISLKETATSLYVQAWVAMGKICLADGKLAKKYIPLFVQELERSDIPALRNNIVVMMADFCIRYTALVDCYIPKITKCLRDSCEIVRRQTFILLSRLLQRDYVKWRGVLFLRFLLCLVDESEKIRHLADFLFGNILKVKAPLLAYNSFVEAIFVLNDCYAQNMHSDSKGSRVERTLFSIKGNDATPRSKRMHIYTCLLKQMAPEHLLATFAKLCAEILAAASDNMLNIEDATGQSVLQDTFQILASKEIRIPSLRGSSDSADMDEEGGGEAAAARGRVVTQAIKKGMIQNTIPIFIELKRLLESKNSPLTGSLMECLRILLKDYKNEIEEILVADKQLQKELIYDMQKYETAKAKSTAAEAAATMKKSDAHQTPKVSKATANENLHCRTAHGVQSNKQVASAMADAAAEATARSVLKEVNQGLLSPPLSAISVPKLKSSMGGALSQGDRPTGVLESLRRRQSFNSDEEN
ncbi:Condensin complex subunit 1, C-terminal [Dillenia turbinata]|uniref:Condensin complex subunit 1, C-terminal n=1 Tax=Dillenia turbinata TaxID=194707 RepID=A0AAN8ZCS2_9MAGN